MRIFFVRHGLTKQKAKKNWLVKKGRIQAGFLAKRLKRIKFDKIYSSDLIRAKQTANIISKKLQIPVIFTSDLREFDEKILFQKQKNWKKKDIGHLKRLRNFLNSISKEKEEDKNILLVAHGVVNEFIISYFMNISYTITRFFSQRNTCINIINWGEVRGAYAWKLKVMGDVSHLPSKLRGVLK